MKYYATLSDGVTEFEYDTETTEYREDIHGKGLVYRRLLFKTLWHVGDCDDSVTISPDGGYTLEHIVIVLENVYGISPFDVNYGKSDTFTFKLSLDDYLKLTTIVTVRKSVNYLLSKVRQNKNGNIIAT